MNQDNDDILGAVDALTDLELNDELSRLLGVKTLPSLKHLLDRLRTEYSIDTKSEPCEDPDYPNVNRYRVYIKPQAWRPLSVTSISQPRALRIAMLVWLRYDPSARTYIRKALRISEK